MPMLNLDITPNTEDGKKPGERIEVQGQKKKKGKPLANQAVVCYTN
ncbi:MAG: hypothetical protein HFE83_07265 [Lachnospiraceae bacterium]|jgi:hypothetical protein|nr:hypothetical protein [Lachnospiraceae bacterium]